MNPFDRILAVSQVFILALWEALGLLIFGWNGLVVLALWFVGIWTFNIFVATAVRTYYKLMEPQIKVSHDGELHAVPDPEEIA